VASFLISRCAFQISRTGDPDTDRLLQKLNSFGHSTTPKVEVDVDSKGNRCYSFKLPRILTNLFLVHLLEVKTEDIPKDTPEVGAPLRPSFRPQLILSLNPQTGNVKSSTEELKQVKKSKAQTPNEAPFKIHKDLPVTSKPQRKVEDDPFLNLKNVVKRDSGSPPAENPSKASVVADEKGVEPTKKVKCIHKQPAEGVVEGPKKS
jgi:hypothetical protein